VGQAKYISTLGLAKGYWQVPVAEEDHPKTAFITPRGLYQFCVMPFGLCGALATFQSMIDHVNRGMAVCEITFQTCTDVVSEQCQN